MSIHSICISTLVIVVSLELDQNITGSFLCYSQICHSICGILMYSLGDCTLQSVWNSAIKCGSGALGTCHNVICGIRRASSIVEKLMPIWYAVTVRIHCVHIRSNLMFDDIPESILIAIIHREIGICIAVCQLLIWSTVIQSPYITWVAIPFIGIIGLHPGFK